MSLAKELHRFRIDKPDKFRLADYDPADTCGLDLEKADAKAMLAGGVERLSALQEKLYAQDQWAVLAIFQAMDAAGKDGAIKHVFSGVNPQGCEVASFKQPSTLELNHDFMWRAMIKLPERGRIGIFNRSYYEECLIVRVHRELLLKEKIPPKLVSKNIWQERFADISAIERYLTRQGTVILKFFLNVSKEEQRERFLDRLDEPAKNWKFSMADVGERKLWPRYQAAYQEMIRHTSTKEAPWFVVPADHKWFARLVIGSVLVSTLESLNLRFPRVDKASLAEFARVREALENEGKGKVKTKAAKAKAAK